MKYQFIDRRNKVMAVESELTFLAALELLKSISEPTEFVQSIVDKCTQYGDRGVFQSTTFWLFKIAEDARLSRDPNRQPRSDDYRTYAGYQAIFRLFKNVTRLKHPTVNFAFEDGIRLDITLSSSTKYAGQLSISDGLPYGANTWFGRIDQEGVLHPSRNMTPELVDLLWDIAKDPVDYAAQYGQNTGRCCFCQKKLTDWRSVTVGYGATCAENWMLPYPTPKSPMRGQAVLI